MSRCFSFPPPGYERKHRPEDSDILKEAKCKEKKHRKEKKDKERRKDKEKEREGGDEKQRDKKDRKGKHRDKKEKNRDKKKDKEDRGREKEKSGISEELTVAGKLEEESGGKLHTKGCSRGASSFPNEGQCSTLFRGQNGGKSSQSSQPSQVIDDSKFVQELDRRIRDDEISRGSQFLDKVPLRDQEMAARVSIGNSSVVPEEKDDNKIKRIDRKMDPQGLSNEYSRNRLVQNPTPTSRNKFDGIPRPLDEQNGRSLEDEEKFKETGDVKWRDKQNNRDKESKGKEKEKKKDKMLKVETENKKSEQGKLKDGDMLENADNNSINEAKIRKRKDMDTNGFLHESEIRLTKMQRPAPYHLTENGSKIEAIQTPSNPSHEMGAASNTGRVDKKDQLFNGVIEAEKAFHSKPNSCAVAEAPKAPNHDSNSSNKALKVPKIEDPIAEASRRPPHPDSKYLAEVLTIPKMADWSDDDDQEWLFRKKSPSKPKVDSTGIEEDLQVWSEAVHIDSADVFALPYVIPY